MAVNSIRVIMMRNSIQTNHDRNLAAINPNSSNFDFDIWAKQVRERMIEVLQKKPDSKLISSDSNY
jgi:hypothetical protein